VATFLIAVPTLLFSLLVLDYFNFSINLDDDFYLSFSATFLGELAAFCAFLAISVSYFLGDLTGDCARISLNPFSLSGEFSFLFV
jgi:hypothetical protein